MDTTTTPPARLTGHKALIQAWMLTLVCPGLGQMRLGARLRGLVTLVVVVGSLIWLGMAYVAPVRDFIAQKAAQSPNVPDATTMMAWVGDPVLRARLDAVSTLPAWIFFLSFVYSFVDSAYLAYGGKQ